MKKARVFWIVLDSFGVGSMPDADKFGDAGADTLGSVQKSRFFHAPFLTMLGLFNIDGVKGRPVPHPQGCFGKAREVSAGKDTTTGHWELAGVVSEKKMPVFPDGFPENVVKEIERRTGRNVLCNAPYSGTEVIKEFGKTHLETGGLIVYTSADSVLQIAAHDSVLSVRELYDVCRKVREIMTGEYAVGRVIARPFSGVYPDFFRTRDRRDFSLPPPKETLLDLLDSAGVPCVGVGKIGDIFCGRGLADELHTSGNEEGLKVLGEMICKLPDGLCFVNLVDFDMMYGHRNDVDGYARAITFFDEKMSELSKELKKGDVVVITADHGCDPAFPGSDHTREYVPVLVFGDRVKKGVNIGVRNSFADVGATIGELLGVHLPVGESFATEILKED